MCIKCRGIFKNNLNNMDTFLFHTFEVWGRTNVIVLYVVKL